ncbi:MAG: hypothetical protein EBZ78_01485 [Verrucomicrobia bacterium]|nr:hypothetical protein [Verrucomicrobiota bacterium]
MNKFFTILPGLLLVLLGKGIGFGEMSPSIPLTATEPPAATQTLSGLPQPINPERYASLGKKSPFTLASAAEEAADFAKDLFITGYVRLAGEDYVMVANKTRPDRILVGKSPSPSAQGMVLVEFKKDPSGNPAKMQAKVKKGTETATLKYESSGGGGGGAPAPMTTAVPTPQSPALPGQPQGNQVQNRQNTPAQGGVPVIRRRVIPIPATSGQKK